MNLIFIVIVLSIIWLAYVVYTIKTQKIRFNETIEGINRAMFARTQSLYNLNSTTKRFETTIKHLTKKLGK